MTDDFKITQTTMYKPPPGLFLSSFEIKAFPDGPLTGMKANFESVPIIASISFNYSSIPDQDIKPISIDRNVL